MEDPAPAPAGRRGDGSIARAFAATGRRVLDVLFPWSCIGCSREGTAIICASCLERVRWVEAPLCPVCGLPLGSGPSHRCTRCTAKPPAFRSARAIACYGAREEDKDPLGKALRALKYAGRRALAPQLGALLTERFPFDPEVLDVVVPVPLHVSRLRQRGFNQALLLARAPARKFGLAFARRAVVRLTPTPPQVGLTEAERRQNVKGAFAVRRGVHIRGKRVLLVDDVATTMATVDACAQALRSAGASSVDVLTLARTVGR